MMDLIDIDIKTLRNAFETGEITSYQLVIEYFKRIAKYDKSGPYLNSVLEINPDAIDIATAMDRERAQGKIRSPLHGVPILLKDNINTKDKMHTSAGSMALKNNYATYDANIVSRIRDAGMVILGKANMTEFANFTSYEMKPGYSSRGGQVINPYNKDFNPRGSSTGSAVAVSANLCMVSMGTETSGSITYPAHNNSVVGIKPTRGLVSRYGIIPISTAQDIAGPIARTVSDAAELLNIIVGEDKEDPSTWAVNEYIPTDYTDFLINDGLKGLRIGINLGYADDYSEEQIGIANKAFQIIRDNGATTVGNCNLPHLKCDRKVLVYEFKQCIEHYLSTCKDIECKTLTDIINYNNSNPRVNLKYGQTRLLDAEYNTSGTLTEPIYLLDRIEALRISREDGLLKILNSNDLDILVSPGVYDASPISGYPSIVVPAGYTSDGMPFGITFVGRPFSEPLLIKAAYGFEQKCNARKPPKLV